MNTGYEEKLSKMKKDLDKAKDLKIRAETRLEQLNQQKLEILGELSNMGVKPEELDNEIDKMKNEIDCLFEEIEKMIPEEIR